MAIFAKNMIVGVEAIEAAKRGKTLSELRQEEADKVKQMAEVVKIAAKPKRLRDPSDNTEDTDGINIIVQRKSEFLDDLTKE